MECLAEGAQDRPCHRDRLVLKFERSLQPDSKRLTEQITEPTDEQIQTLLDKVSPKLRGVLRTPQSVYRFIDLLTLSFEGIERRVTDEGILIVKPVQLTEPVRFYGTGFEIEPLSPISDVLAEADQEPM